MDTLPPRWAGWLEVYQETGYPDASLLWYGGSVLPVDNVYKDGEKLVVNQVRQVVRKKDALGNPLRTHTVTNVYTFELKGANELSGVATLPKDDVVVWK